jgi:integrase
MNTTRTSRRTKPVNSSRQSGGSRNRKNGNGNGKRPQPYQKNDGNWYCTYQGRQYYLGSDPLRAQVKLETILAGSGDIRSRGGPTIKGVVESYLDSLVNNQSADTIQNKKSTYKQFVEFIDADTLISDISAAVIEGYKQYALSRNKRPTVRTNLVRLSALFQYAVKTGSIPTNPVREVPAIKLPNDPDPDHLTEEEVEKLYELTQEQRYPSLANRDKLVFMLILHAGLRRIEVSNLKWSDVDLDRSLIVLRTTKGEKPRMIGISETLHHALQDCWDNWRLSDEYVITNRNGGQLSREGLGHLARKYTDRMNHHYQGRKRFGLHCLRATFATTLAGKGVGTRVIQGLLGHSDPRTVLRYAAYTEKMAVEAVKVLDS